MNTAWREERKVTRCDFSRSRYWRADGADSADAGGGVFVVKLGKTGCLAESRELCRLLCRLEIYVESICIQG